MAANDGMNASENANQNGTRPIQLAQANVPNVASSASGPNVVHVTPPAPGAREEITVLPGQTVVLDGVDLATARVERVEGGLLITLADGGMIFLAGFADAAGSANPPHVEIPGLGALEAAQLLAAADANVSNIQPAAGPGAGGAGGAAAHGGGANFSDIIPGSIGDGLGRQGLGPQADFNRTPPEGNFVFGPITQDTTVVTPSAVSFGIAATPASVRESFGWFGSGSEGGPTDVGHYTVTLTGTLNTGAHASVVLNVGGTATPGTDYGSTSSSSANMDTIIGTAVGGSHVGSVWTNVATGMSYDSSTHTLTFTGGGATSLTFNMSPVDDNIVEGTENASVTLSNATATDGTAVIGTSSASINITDNDSLTLTIGNAETVEGSPLVYNLSLSNPSAQAQTYHLTAGTPGTATPGTDYSTSFEFSTNGGATWTAASGNNVTFAAGTTTMLVRVATTDDSVYEGTETNTVSATLVSGFTTNTTDTGQGFIGDNDNPPAFSINDVTVAESAGTITFTITKTGDTALSSSVDYSVAPNTATTPADYTAGTSPLSGTVSFLPGETTKTITLNVVNDTIFEGSENFNVNLSNAVNATISDNQGVGTITDNDALTIALSGSTTVTEGSSANYTVALGSVGLGAGQSVSFTIDAVSGTATEGVDFGSIPTPASGLGIVTSAGPNGSINVTITNNSGSDLAGGSTLATWSVPTTADGVYESSEDFTATLSSGTATVTGSPVTTTIVDNDAQPSFSINDVTVNESAGTITFTVTKTGATALPSAVDYSVAPNTATTPADYGAGTSGLTGTVFFAAGDTTKTITLNIVNDTIFEGSETFFVNLGASVNATVSDAQGIGTITDNDSPALSLSGTTTVAEGGTASYSVTLNGVGLGAGQAITMTLDSASGTATEVTDFAKLVSGGLVAGTGVTISNVTTDGVTGAVTFTVTNTSGSDIAAGATIASVSLATVDDTIVESSENFTVSLSSSATVSGSPVTTTITDNDTMALALSGSTSVTEGAAANYSVTLNGVALGAGQAVTFTLDSASGTATEVTDFAKLISSSITAGTGITLSNITTDGVTGAVTVTATNTSGSTIAAGTALATVSLTTVNDVIVEGNENFTVSLSSSAVVTGSPVTTTITDNDTMALSLSGSASVTEGSSASYSVTLNGVGLGVGQAVTMTLDSASGTATEVTDFAKLVAAGLTAGTGITISGVTTDGTTGAVTFTVTNTGLTDIAAGSTLVSVNLSTVNDTFVEGNENFTVSLSSAAAVTGSPVTTTITDNDTMALSLSGSASVTEGSSASYSVTLNGVGLGAGQAVTMTLDSASGTATEVTDFAKLVAAGLTAGTGITISNVTTDGTTGAVTFTVTNTGGTDIAAGSTLVSVNLSTVNDVIVEGAENFTVSLSSAAAVTGSPVTTTITDNDTMALSLSGSASVTEGSNASYSVALNGVGLGAGKAVTFTLDSASGTATEVADFAKLLSGALTAASGITLSGITVDGTTGAVTVTATNTSGSDIAAGSNLVTFNLATVDDTIVEGSENFTVSLTSAATVTGSPVTTTITDNDTMALSLSGSSSVTEGSNASYSVTLNGVGLGAGKSVTMTLDSASGTATEVTDFAQLIQSSLTAGTGITLSNFSVDGTTGAVTFTATNTGGTDLAAGSTLATVSLATVNDTIAEANETFTVSLSSTATVTGSPVTTTITDNDALTLTIGDSGATPEGSFMVFHVSLSNTSDVAQTYQLTSAGSGASPATPVTDYGTQFEYSTDGGTTWFTATSNQITFAAGTTSMDVRLPALTDAVNEADETLTVSASLVSGHTTTTTDTGLGTITDTTPNILDGALTTNSNSSLQVLTTTFVEVAAPWHASAFMTDLNAQGQQGNLIHDVGFNIDNTLLYQVGLEAVPGSAKVQVTDFTLEQVTIQGSGNAGLQVDDTSSTSSSSTALTAVIDPQTGTTQAKTLSTDGDAGANTQTDATPTTLNYLFGAGGNDSLTGSSGSDFLNGGANGASGGDTIHGGGGNDIIVYDPNDAVMDGGSNASGPGDFDLLRVDQGALSLTLAGSGDPTNTFGPADNVSVSLIGKTAVQNIEGILITEEAGASTNAVDPNDNVGTTLILDKAFVLSSTDSDHVLYVLGNNGDVLQVNSQTQWNQTPVSTVTDSQNQTLVTYHSTDNTATLVVDAQVQVVFHA